MSEKANPEFIAEAQEIVDALNAGLISAESDARSGEVEPALVNNLFRHAHSLKGISGMFGLEQISSLAHALESVLDGMRLGKVALDAAALDVLFACVERFNEMIQAAAKGDDVDEARLDDLLRRLDAVAEGPAEGAKGPDPLRLAGVGEDVLAVLTEYEEHRLRDNIRRGRGLYLLRTAFDLSNFDVGLAELDEAVKGLGELITKLPSSTASSPDRISFDIIVGSDKSRDEISLAIADDDVEVTALQHRGPTKGRVAAEDKVAALVPDAAAVPEDDILREPGDDTGSVRSVAQTVRVDIRRLDRLMNLVGELALVRMTLEHLSVEIRRQASPEVVSELHQLNRNFERRLRELQDGIMEVRMVPLANLFERMVRIGRRMGRELEREVRLELSGKDTELDKLLVEELADPLMHIIRNAIDHGIEPTAERTGAGKPEAGHVRLSAAALGNHVVVQVQDDGRGIDPDHIRLTAIAKGLLEADRAAELSRREAFNLLFLPGFSTKQDVSEYSGRGVGLDVVKTNITRLSGVIDVESEKGKGTTITITLPITLAIISALIVRVAGREYAIPLNNVLETLAIEQKRVQTIERREVIDVRGATVPVVQLRDLFSLGAPEKTPNRFGVLIGAGDVRLALVVDELVGHQDIVIKSLGKHLRNVPGIAGATELGDQKIVLVIDTVELLNELTTGQLRRLTA